jgi:hypothetical protein
VAPFIVAQVIGTFMAVYLCRWLLAGPAGATVKTSSAE